jgi:hypothetical protein
MSKDKDATSRQILLYCVIAVLINGLLALGWVIWLQADLMRKQSEQIIDLQSQLKHR